MNTIQVSPELISQYMDLNKNAMIVHLVLKAVAQDGKLERNIKWLSRRIGRLPHRVRDAEGELKRKELLCIHWNGDKRFWYVYDRPTRPEAVLPSAQQVVPSRLRAGFTENPDDENQKQKSLWQRIKYAFTGDDLDYELTKP